MSVYGFSSSMTVPLKSGAPITPDSVGKERRMSVFCRAKKIALEPRRECELKGFVLETRVLVEWTVVPLLLAHCCDIPKAKDMSGLRLGFAVKRPSIMYVMTGEDIICGQMAHEWSLSETAMVRKSLLNIPRSNIASVSYGNEVGQE